MEIDITDFFNESDPSEYSASIAETGLSDIGKRTWRAAKDESARAPLLSTSDEIDALRSYVKDFGAWSEEEIAAWTEIECNALFIQLISGDIRETGMFAGDSFDWEEYERGAERGRWSGNLFKSGERVFYSLSH